MDANEKSVRWVNKQDIKAGLRRLGLKNGDSIGVHSSLASLGRVEGGADAVIDVLLEIVGEEGNIVMLTHSANLVEVQRTPEEIAMGVSWMFRILPYDPVETSVRTGIIPETFRKRRGVVRGSHPSNSVAALGPRAREYSLSRFAADPETRIPKPTV